jgi:peptidoglycan/xylan/chitin deacetylase (PgdA/CDA1 family)
VPIALIYHDVVPPGDFDASGFAGAGAARYKLFTDEFQRHLEALDRLVEKPFLAAPPGCIRAAAELPCLLTFDDGGASFLQIASLLAERGWTGQFFITTDFIGTPGFLTRDEVRQLRTQGHVVGSHSCSHPQRMSGCSWELLLDEWRRSCEILADITGAPITTGSVPGGFYSRRVAEAAAQAGIRILYTSEPTTSPHHVDGCTVFGRYSIDRSVTVEGMSAIVSGRLLPRLRQAFLWKAKGLAKTLAGPLYAGIRNQWLGHDYEVVQSEARESKRTSGTPQ